MTNRFDSEANFAVDYKEILDIPGNPESIDKTYALDETISARYVSFERQKKEKRLHFGELEILADMP